MLKKENIYSAYVSKHNLNCKKQDIVFMMPHGEGWHYLVLKELSKLLSGITTKHQGDI